jgi:hypothetical protein
LPPQHATRPTQLRAPLLALAVGLAFVLAACGRFIPGEWQYTCEPSLVVPETGRCHAALPLDGSSLAFIPEGDGWLFAGAWLGEDYRLIQATLDLPGLRRAVRLEDGYCSGPVCWIEFTDAEVERILQRSAFRVELTRVVHSDDTGRMRRGSTGFLAPTRGLDQAVTRLRTDPAAAAD